MSSREERKKKVSKNVGMKLYSVLFWDFKGLESGLKPMAVAGQPQAHSPKVWHVAPTPGWAYPSGPSSSVPRTSPQTCLGLNEAPCSYLSTANNQPKRAACSWRDSCTTTGSLLSRRGRSYSSGADASALQRISSFFWDIFGVLIVLTADKTDTAWTTINKPLCASVKSRWVCNMTAGWAVGHISAVSIRAQMLPPHTFMHNSTLILTGCQLWTIMPSLSV